MNQQISEAYGVGPERKISIDPDTGICSVEENDHVHRFYPTRVPHVYHMEGWQGEFNGSFFEGESIRPLFLAHIDQVYVVINEQPESAVVVPAFGGLVSYYFLLRKYFFEKNPMIFSMDVHFTAREKYGDRSYVFIRPIHVDLYPQIIVVDDNADTQKSYYVFCETITGVYGPDERVQLHVFSRKSYTESWPGNFSRVPVTLQPFWATTGGGMEGSVFEKAHQFSSRERLFDGFLTAPPFSDFPTILKRIMGYGALLREHTLASGDDPLFHFHLHAANIGTELESVKDRIIAQVRFLTDFHANMLDLFWKVHDGQLSFEEAVYLSMHSRILQKKEVEVLVASSD